LEIGCWAAGKVDGNAVDVEEGVTKREKIKIKMTFFPGWHTEPGGQQYIELHTMK